MSSTEINSQKENITAASTTKIYDSADQEIAINNVASNNVTIPKAPLPEAKRVDVPKSEPVSNLENQRVNQVADKDNISSKQEIATPNPKPIPAQNAIPDAEVAKAQPIPATVQSAAAPAKSIIDVAKANVPVKPKDELPEKLIVMTIDDDKWIQRIFTQYIGQWGFKHYQASDPFKGLMDAIKYQPHLIFLDIVLPEVGGEIVLQFLRNMEATKSIPVVIISGNLNKELIRNAYVLGAKGFITKPFNQEILFSKIKETLDPILFQKMVDAGRIIPNIPVKKPQVKA